MASLNTKVYLNIIANVLETIDLGTSSKNYAEKWSATLGNGSAVDLASLVYADSVTALAASGTQSYDLDGLAAAQPGNASFAAIKALAIRVPAGKPALKLGGDFILTKFLIPGADTLSAVTIPVPAGGTEEDSFFFWFSSTAAGVVVTATTGDGLSLTNASGSVTADFDLVLIGI